MDPTNEGERPGACAHPYPKNSVRAVAVALVPSSTPRQPNVLSSRAGGLLEAHPPSSNSDYRDMALDWNETVRANMRERREGLELQAKLEVAGTNQWHLYTPAILHPVGAAAELPFPIHAHMLRHAAGYALAARGVDTRTLQAFMGHRSIANTVVYTAVADKRIRNIWGK